ncbi:hypothetical protein ACLMJK_002334 [Lecanora helva]
MNFNLETFTLTLMQANFAMEKTNINLVILSPSSEVNKLTFSSISTTTTIGELRERITAAVSSHPPPGRQRLIYRGHPLLDANRTLKDVFTQEIVIDNSDTLSLHLVLPPEPATLPGSSANPTTTPNHVQQNQTSQHLQGVPSNSGTPHIHQQGAAQPSIQGSTSQFNAVPPQFPGQPGQTQHIHVHGALPNAQFPPQLQQAFVQLQAVNQQLMAQLTAVGANPGMQGMAPNHVQVPLFQQPPVMQPPMQMAVPHQQQQQLQQQQQQQQQQQSQTRMVNEQAGLGTVPQQPRQGTPPVQGNVHGVGRSPTPRNTNTIVRENRGPNGERIQMIIQSGQMNVNPNPGNLNHPHLPGPQPVPVIARHGSPAAHGSQAPQRPTSSTELRQFQSNLSTMETAMAGGNPLPDSVFDQAREILAGIPDLPQEERSTLGSRLNSLAERSNHLRRTLNNHLTRAAQERVAAQRSNHGPQSSAVYVLSSPSGPQALLISPTGRYSAPWQFPSISPLPPSSFIQHHSQELPSQTQSSSLRGPVGAHQPTSSANQIQRAVQQNAAPAHAAPAHHEHLQQQQQQQANQARDILRILLPLGGNLWLLVRLFGFVYFFTAGAGWRRTILLGLVACLVFVAQTGVFRPVIQGMWEPIRRHAEGLVPLAGAEREGTDRAGANANAGAVQRPHREPTPQEAAERLLQEREQRDVNFLRQSFRRVERAVALFVASLVPGVGERHIAAREAAEAARQAEAREREEQARRAEAEASQQGQGDTSQGTGTAANPGPAAEAPQEPVAPDQDQNPLPPVPRLIDV